MAEVSRENKEQIWATLANMNGVDNIKLSTSATSHIAEGREINPMLNVKIGFTEENARKILSKLKTDGTRENKHFKEKFGSNFDAMVRSIERDVDARFGTTADGATTTTTDKKGRGTDETATTATDKTSEKVLGMKLFTVGAMIKPDWNDQNTVINANTYGKTPINIDKDLGDKVNE